MRLLGNIKPTKSALWWLFGVAWIPCLAQNLSLEESSRFLSRASIGANWEDLVYLSEVGKEAWIVEQINQPYTPIAPQAQTIIDFYSTEENFLEFNGIVFRYALWNKMLGHDDQLRQRVTLALSEILVVSEVGSELDSSPMGLSLYYDMLARNAFGNYADLLREIIYSAQMGSYLSHAGNQKADPETNRFPDENFAREIMQLFTIGLHELNRDGTLRSDAFGNPIPTYDNDDIQEFAKVFTGLIYNYYELLEEYPRLGSDEEELFSRLKNRGYVNFEQPMVPVESQHDSSQKTLLNGVVLPAGQSIAQDIDGAIQCLMQHPNTAPFISKQLIQRLVTSNPSPAYVDHVASVFENNGSGVRGDMAAVVYSILMYPEANAVQNGPISGKMREPFIKMLHLLRGFDAANHHGNYWNSTWWEWENFKQRPFSSPSVFNFFQPSYAPQGEISDLGFVAPEFQIFDSQSIPGTVDLLLYMVFYDIWSDPPEGTPEDWDPLDGDRQKPWRMDLKDELALAFQGDALVDRLSLILTGGRLSEGTRNIVLNAMDRAGDDPEYRVRIALWTILISPEYNIQK
jgi:uncharacterized protein (DUF1800 family)